MPSRDGGEGPAAGGRSAGATLGALVREITLRLKSAGIDEPASEARRIVSQAAGVPALDLVVRPETVVAAAGAEAARSLARRREMREPLSRIVGERAFYGRPFWLSPGTLDPRPETELLVEVALAQFARMARRRGPRPLRLLDAGTGTGAIAITLLAELAHASALAIDLSEDALATARRNARRHGVGERLRLELRDMLATDWIAAEPPFDLIVSNPPYIPSGEIAGLEAEVRLFDPLLALDGGPDGLVAYRALSRYLERLAPGGGLIVEVGAGQAGDVAKLLAEARVGLEMTVARDLGGHERVVAVWTQPAQGEG